MRKSRAGAFLALAVVGGLTATAAPSHAAGNTTVTPKVVATGLQNPRGVTVQDDGSVLVAESGIGPAVNPCSAPGAQCMGFTGSIYQVKGSQERRVVTGLPSKLIVRADGSTVVAGVNQADATGAGTYRVVNSLSGTPESRAALGTGAEPLGALAIAGGRVLGDLTALEGSLNPDAGEVLSNPQRSIKDGRDFLVTDAAGNTLIRVLPDGTSRTEFVFPKNDTAEAVPTGIVRGADGAYYISDMSGIRKGMGRVWRYVPGSTPTVFTTGLTGVIDLAVATNGDLIALSYATGDTVSQPNTGALTRIHKKTGALTKIDIGTTLNLPTGLDIAPNGDMYITNNTLSANGELLKVPAA